ncbi:acyl-CoA desaturase [Lamprobacter modestohalophilus]|uniref:Acyl-CoA desaturase n=1 Tax=Lamprobacter modestohalophilus TaxID=1064514 RepID=A0A9X1B5G5_9GAMM|nr:fatty acid desaturase [Lamprobacter modestohalophilus]MBK1620505.1 acyl-CoA desaturase [Lamprobacter modestohalophilus]
MTVYGLLNLPAWQVVLIALGFTHITIAAVTIFLHRAQAHRALSLHPIPEHFFRFWLWLTTGMVTREWVAVHRKHHARCETAEDPHSPQVFGLRKVFWQGAELYSASAKDASIVKRFGSGTPDDWIERNLYSRLTWQGCGLMLIIDLTLFGVYGITVWAVQMLWIPIMAAGVINGVGHFWGYRNFETPDASTNVSPWGILIGGEELHNNHHAFPSSARLSMRWWEFDIGWFYIRMLSLLGLAKVKKLPPKSTVVEGKQVVDMETLKALLVTRMHVIRRYSKEVLQPVTRAELCRSEPDCRRIARRANKLLVRERLDETSRKSLEQILARSQQLEVVYQFREQLRQIWERNAPSQEALLKSLQDWCQRAEATGIQALEGFSRNLRGLALVGAPA